MTSSQPASRSPLLDRKLPLLEDANIPFAEPWEARAFAMVVQMSQAGHFTWGEWVECFAQEVAAATEDECRGAVPPGYYQQWLRAAEKLMIAKGVVTSDQLKAKKFALAAAGPAHILPMAR
jgi:nitrile hydratase accessory protein